MDLPDFRPQLAQAQGWVADLIDGVRPEQLDDPTPCTELDVRTLIGHLYAVAGRVQAMGHGRPAENEPWVIEDLDLDALRAGYVARTAQALQAWSDDSTLTRVVRAPWGEVPGALAIAAYVTESMTHGWDLAVATGQDSEADPELAELALGMAQRAIPADNRGGPVPFEAAVEPSPEAGPTERLANFLGRQWFDRSAAGVGAASQGVPQ